MENKLPLQELSIKEIYQSSLEYKTYEIPIYQRNYAWEEDQIRALVRDVNDSLQKDASLPYYIGTLVTFKRGEHTYEVIDGQQRLTTIYLILKALNQEIKNHLTYKARTISAVTLDKLDDLNKFQGDVDEGIRRGYEYAQKAIRDLVGSDTEAFKNYFLNKTHIIHYSVPKDVDLNHYFEVMNSRGEQLEKHEIVKAKLSGVLRDKELDKFSHIWEACTKMNVFVQQAFNKDGIFDECRGDFNKTCFEDIPEQDSTDEKLTIQELINGSFAQTLDSEEEKADKFQPIIDFPNFLLIVLKVTMLGHQGFDVKTFKLDDKELLNEFDNALILRKEDKVQFAKEFVFNLLKARYYLDNFIVHHTLEDKEIEGDNPWKLQKYHYESAKSKHAKNLFEKQDELVHLLSMFEVTFTPKQRKNYLFYCLLYLFEKGKPTYEEYLSFLQNLADRYFFGVYMNRAQLTDRNQPKPNAFDEIILEGSKLNVEKFGDFNKNFESIYQQGSMEIPLYVFNYMDYKLWKKYADELRGKDTKEGDDVRKSFFEELGCKDFGLKPFDNFYFSRTRKSLEHYYPQANVGEGKPSAVDINCFGNFAMIGAEANSSGSNWTPKSKYIHYSDKKIDPVSVASLKFKIMMQMCKDHDMDNSNRLNREPWDSQDMEDHQVNMLAILFK